jgi:hypothetical protein
MSAHSQLSYTLEFHVRSQVKKREAVSPSMEPVSAVIARISPLMVLASGWKS